METRTERDGNFARKTKEMLVSVSQCVSGA